MPSDRNPDLAQPLAPPVRQRLWHRSRSLPPQILPADIAPAESADRKIRNSLRGGWFAGDNVDIPWLIGEKRRQLRIPSVGTNDSVTKGQRRCGLPRNPAGRQMSPTAPSTRHRSESYGL